MKKKKVKKIVISLLVLVVCLTLLYNFATSQYCIKKIILPIVAEKSNASISVGNIEVSPLKSSIMISNLEYKSPEVSMQSEKFVVKSSIYDFLINRKINIKTLLLENSNVKLNITSSSQEKSAVITTSDSKIEHEKRTSEKKESKALPYKISLNDLNIVKLNLIVNNDDTVTKLSNFNLNIPNIEPDKKCKINLDGNIFMSDGNKTAEGFIKSKSIIVVNNKFLPIDINSASLINLDGNKMPLSILLKTKKDGSFRFTSNASNIMVKPFVKTFLAGKYSNTEGHIESIKIEANGSSIDDLLTCSSPIESSIAIKNINIFSKNNFSVENKSIRIYCDLSSILNGNFLPNKFSIHGLNADYTDNDQIVKVNNLNVGINKKANNELKAILNTGFYYSKDNKQLKGLLVGNIEFGGADLLNPENLNSILTLQLNEYKMPIKIKYGNNSANEKVDLNIKDFNFSVIKDFIDNAGQKLSGKIEDLSIAMNGEGLDSLKKGFRKDSNIAINTLISANNLKVLEKGKYAVSIPKMEINLDLNKIINKKYYVNLFKVDNPNIVFIKKTDDKEIVYNDKPSRPAMVLPKSSPKVEKKKQKDANVDFDLKNLQVNNLKAEIVADKKMVLSNVNIYSKEIKANTPGKVNVNLNYQIDDNLKGNIKTLNDILITSSLVPELVKSQIELLYGETKSISNIELKCNKQSNSQLPFTFNAQMKDLLLDPFLMALMKSPYNMTKTNIADLNITLKGDDLYNLKTTDGSIKSNLNSISIPVNIKDKNILEVMFFPLRMLAELSSNTALRFVSGDLGNAMIKIDNMFNQEKRIDFKKGSLDVDLNSGIIEINNFDFYGVENSPVEEIKASGLINLNNRVINLNTNTLFASLKIPLEVKGTIDKPKTDTANMTAQILQENSDTIIKTGLDMTNTVNETLNQIKNKNFSELLSRSTDKSNPEQGNVVDQLLNSFIQPQQQNVKKQQEPKTQNKADDTVNQIFGILNKIGNKEQNTSTNNKKQDQSLGDVNDQIKSLLNF